MRLVNPAFRSVSAADRDSDELDYAMPERRGFEEASELPRLVAEPELEPRGRDGELANRLRELTVKEELAEAAMRSAEIGLQAAAGEARQRSQEAEYCWKRVEEASRLLEARSVGVARDLNESIELRRQAAQDLASARQDLTAAYQFAAVAAEERITAKRFYEAAARRATLSMALSWLAAAWMAWLAFRHAVPFLVPALITAGVGALAVWVMTKAQNRG